MRQSDGRPCGANCTSPEACDRTTSGCALGYVRLIQTGSPFRVQAPPPRVDSAFPGAQLRWVHRDIKSWTVPVLQQLWQVDKADGTIQLEWRDVPVEVEDGSPPLGNPPNKV